MTHPGEIIADELKSRKIKQVDFSERIGMKKSQFNEILKGKRSIPPELALWLDYFFIGTTQYWINAQAKFDLEEARQTFKPPVIALLP